MHPRDAWVHAADPQGGEVASPPPHSTFRNSWMIVNSYSSSSSSLFLGQGEQMLASFVVCFSCTVFNPSTTTRIRRSNRRAGLAYIQR